MNGSNSLKERLGIAHIQGFDFLLACLWSMGILLYYTRTFVSRSPLYFIAPEFMTICIVSGILFSLSYFKKTLRVIDIIVYLIIVAYYYLNMVIFPANKEVLSELSFLCLIHSVPLFLIGLSLNVEKSYNYLRFISGLSIIVLAVVLFLMGGVREYELTGDEGEGMVKAYALLPCLLFIVWDTLRTPNIVNTIISLLGVIILFSLGTRGPIVCLLAFIVLFLLLFKEYKHPIRNRILVFCAGGVLYTFLTPILLAVQGLLMSVGASTRIVNTLLEDTFDDSHGRDDISSFMWGEIMKDPWSGHGLAGDRVTGHWASWSHNFALEIFMAFGLALGCVILGVLLWMLIKIVIKDIHSVHTQFTILLFCSSVMMLMFSSSFLQEPMIYLFIGYMVNILRKNSTINRNI